MSVYIFQEQKHNIFVVLNNFTFYSVPIQYMVCVFSRVRQVEHKLSRSSIKDLWSHYQKTAFTSFIDHLPAFLFSVSSLTVIIQSLQLFCKKCNVLYSAKYYLTWTSSDFRRSC